jgi:pre-mRNA-processing factor SLU7
MRAKSSTPTSLVCSFSWQFDIVDLTAFAEYIAQAPWYLDTGAPSLAHQRIPEYDHSADKLDNWYDRGAKAGPAAKKYRKGACENCGALTHKKEDCLERPRKRGAKYTGKDIAPDEVIQEVATGYDAKRDRWNGYDPSEHKRVYEEYQAVEAARQRLREEEIDKQTTTDLAAVRKVAKAGKEKAEGDRKDDDFGSSDEDDEDADKYAESADAVGQKLDTKTRITVRNLRIREDTAKYLINLDPSSAYYDPKTRSMRENPLKNVPPEEARFAGENFLRYSGEAAEVQKLQLFAWNAASRGNDVHVTANPTEGQLLHQQYQKAKEQLKDTTKVSILAKYGGEEYLQKAPKELLQGQSEEYVEFSRTGQVVKGKERAKVRSKYAEDGQYILLDIHACGDTNFCPQFTSTTILRFGAHGTISGPASGVMHAATPQCTFPTVPAKQASKRHRPQVHRIFLRPRLPPAHHHHHHHPSLRLLHPQCKRRQRTTDDVKRKICSRNADLGRARSR